MKLFSYFWWKCTSVSWSWFNFHAGGELADFIIVLRNTDAIKTFRGNAHLSVGAGIEFRCSTIQLFFHLFPSLNQVQVLNRKFLNLQPVTVLLLIVLCLVI
ncbi:hypothetical protein BRADI_3g17524v3 [Brachypodium distachyon]|uniref:Uncharacterized protein n=1 Tax=Brachypodium distachyon TaxID=15368 RepID=A0A2K2CXV6_BRADI|nr:hypothetical protein BRADI_3g17524v3 [Brachypodium distachyon]